MTSKARAVRPRESKAKAEPVEQPLTWRLPAKLVSDYLEREGLTVAQVRAGEPPVEIVEAAIADEDPVAWSILWLREEAELVGEDGTVWSRRGDPWRLAPVQERMARLRGNLIFECGAEVGKTRDVVLQTLWEVDKHERGRGPLKILIVGNRELTTKAIFRALLSAIGLSFEFTGRRIGGGLKGKPNFSDFLFEFENGATVELRISGTDGENLKNAHVHRIFVDEASAMKNPTIFDMIFRALLVGPGNYVRIYSTPDGDYSSPFWGLCNRAIPTDGRTFEERTAETAKISDEEQSFQKFNISKDDLPPPFMTPERRRKLVAFYGGEHSVGFVTLFLGRWGSPSYSVFPMESLRPNLRKDLDSYRLLVIENDRTERRVRFRVSRLGTGEEILVDDSGPFFGGDDLGERIARFVDLRPRAEGGEVFCGVDLGSATDPSELLFVSRTGEGGRVWEDRTRIHLRGVDWHDQERVFLYVDHTTGHSARYSLDSGGAGRAVVSHLQDSPEYALCPVCRAPVGFSTRLVGVNPGETLVEVDPDTGETVLSDQRNAAGERVPSTLNAKEFATRVLERKCQRVELRIGDDRGAGDPALAAQTLLVNHTSTRISSKGVRVFRDKNDHSVDARRQVVFAIASGVRVGGWVAPDPATLASIPRNGSTSNLFREQDVTRKAGHAPAAYAVYTDELEAENLFEGRGGVRGGFDADDW